MNGVADTTKKDTTTKLAVLGAGAMGGSIARGVLAAQDPPEVVVTTPTEDRLARWRELGVRALADNVEAVRGADVVLVAVKPHLVVEVLREVGEHVRGDAVVVSVAAGIGLAALEAALPAGTAVVRVMPNTPAMVGEGMSVMSVGGSASMEQVERTRLLLSAVGRTRVLTEGDMDAATAVSGSGVAYVYYMAEAMIDAGVALGLTRAAATELTVQTVRGAGVMLSESGTHPTLLREQVVSPGGTTAAAMAEFARGGLSATILNGMEAARNRSRELGQA